VKIANLQERLDVARRLRNPGDGWAVAVRIDDAEDLVFGTLSTHVDENFGRRGLYEWRVEIETGVPIGSTVLLHMGDTELQPFVGQAVVTNCTLRSDGRGSATLQGAGELYRFGSGGTPE